MLVMPDVALETELLTLVNRVTVEATEVLTLPRLVVPTLFSDDARLVTPDVALETGC